MKRIFTFVLSLLVFLCAASAVAEEIDISSLTLDELVELQGKITSRVNDLLGAPSDVMYMGKYVGGVDIKAGRYWLTALVSESYFDMYLYEDASAMDDYNPSINQILHDGDICEIEIKDGMILLVSKGSAMITPRTKPSWVP